MQPPPHFNVVGVTAGPSRPDDEMLTRNLLQSTLHGDRYQCPRCAFNTQNPEEMIHHLADEINKSINAMVTMHTTTPPPKTEPK